MSAKLCSSGTLEDDEIGGLYEERHCEVEDVSMQAQRLQRKNVVECGKSGITMRRCACINDQCEDVAMRRGHDNECAVRQVSEKGHVNKVPGDAVSADAHAASAWQ